MELKVLMTILSLIVVAKSDGNALSSTKIPLQCDSFTNEELCCDLKLRCNVKNLVVNSRDTFISQIIDQNGTEIKDGLKAIDALNIHEQQVKFIPQDITKFLPNLKAIVIDGSNLESIEKEDLKQFGKKLKFLHVGRNKLTSLSSDLVEYTPSLKYFYFHENPLKFIGSGIIKNLKQLEFLYFTSCKDHEKHNYKDFKNFDTFHGCNDKAEL